jgi:hypothetical protein
MLRREIAARLVWLLEEEVVVVVVVLVLRDLPGGPVEGRLT